MMQVYINSTDEDMKHPGHIIIDYLFCIDWIDNSMNSDHYRLEPDTLALAKIVFDDVDLREDNWKIKSTGIKTMIARIDFTLKSQLLGELPLVWRLPETGIYPQYQANIAQLMIEMGLLK